MRPRPGGPSQILDVRSPAEWQAGSLLGARWCYVPDLAERVSDEFDVAQPVWLMCASGFRASIAAGLLQRGGYTPVVLARVASLTFLER